MSISKLFPVLAAAALSAQAGTYTYEALIHAGQAPCVSEAQALSDRFSTATGLSGVSAQCHSAVDFAEGDNHFTLYPMTLTYTATHPYRPYTAVLGRALVMTAFPDELAGVYTSYATCVADLGVQSARYQAYTGLVVVDANCRPGYLAGNYVMRINGFADAENAYEKARAHLYAVGFAPLGGEALAPDFTQLLNSEGALGIQHYSDTFLYYKAYPAQLSVDLLASLSNRRECESQMEEARAIANALGSSNAVVHCLPMSDQNPDGINYLQVMRAGGYMTGRDFGANSQDYFTFDQCIEDRQRVLGQTQNRSERMAGGICHSDDNRRMYRLEIFSGL